ncbi:MAG: PhnD/SsuA/transferrin family substrate-binding protein [Motiliproteus sp.]
MDWIVGYYLTVELRKNCRLVLLSFLFVSFCHASTEQTEKTIRIGVTPVFLNYQTSMLGDWKLYLQERLGRPVQFVQRTTYKEITDLILQDKIEFAWICGYPYLQYQNSLQLLAVPLYHGRPVYQSYLIVHASDQTTTSIAQLQNKIFAYSDPDSNSGYLVPQYQIQRLGADRSDFFRRSFFTWAHEKVVEAVAMGVAQGGAVDGYVWDTLAMFNPEVTRHTRVAQKSQEFGFPPFVASNNVSEEDFYAIQNVLLQMNTDSKGIQLLQRLNLDGFSIQDRSLFDGIAAMKEVVEQK